MNSEFSYKILLLTQEKSVTENLKEVANTLSLSLHVVAEKMEALEYLMDVNVDSIVLDVGSMNKECLEFIDHICDDYENKLTPLFIITQNQDYTDLAEQLSSYNVLSIMSNQNWYLQIEKALNYLKIQKLNTHFMQESLIESEERGTMDTLTGAYNRYGCEDMFHTLTSRDKAYKEPFCAVMIDLDHFKQINDVHGHDIGDEVLVSTTNLIMSKIRRDDTLIRLGGEEFIIFFANANLNITAKNAEKIRKNIEESSHSSKELKITASFSVVQYDEQEDMKSFLKRADDLLYEAKNAGRNVVVTQK